MNIEERSLLAANRRNNRTQRELPLLTAQGAIPTDMLTTPAAQQERLERQESVNDAYFARLRQFNEECEIEAQRLREFCRSHLDRDGFSVLETRARYTEHLEPVYRLDYWSRAAARLEPSLCPHAKNDHEVCRILEHECCPICGVILEISKADSQQLSLW